MSRRALIAKLHIAKKELRLEEGTYRAALEAATGKRSAADMNYAELEQAVEHFKACGWNPQKGKKGKLSPKTRDLPEARDSHVNQQRMVRALWIEAYRLGAVENRYEEALNAFVKNKVGIERIDWVRENAHFRSLIGALTAMVKAKGGDVGR
jgi:phage gp16-like protein